MPNNPLNLAVIVASTRSGRFAPVITDWFVEQVERHGAMNVDVIDLAQARLPAELPGFGQAPEPEAAQRLAGVSPRLAAADGFVMVTPEYNHSFPAPLKSAIDWHGSEWKAKPLGFVSYGGISGGLRAVEQLRVVMAEMHTVTIRDTVSFHGAGSLFNDQGRLIDPSGPEAAAKTMLDQLTWWANALRDAKAAHPYRV